MYTSKSIVIKINIRYVVYFISSVSILTTLYLKNDLLDRSKVSKFNHVSKILKFPNARRYERLSCAPLRTPCNFLPFSNLILLANFSAHVRGERVANFTFKAKNIRKLTYYMALDPGDSNLYPKTRLISKYERK